MAISAIATTVVQNRTVFGNKRIVTGYLTFAADTWPAGGISFTGADVGIGGFDFVYFAPSGLQWKYDYTNKKIDGVVCGTAGNNQVQVAADGATISASDKVYFLVVGHGKG
jgi:hypothetical protein